MAPRAQQEDTMLILGEIRGQLRELIHNSNNNAAKLDALALRVNELEGERRSREGAYNVKKWLVDHSPWATLAALAAAVAAWWRPHL